MRMKKTAYRASKKENQNHHQYCHWEMEVKWLLYVVGNVGVSDLSSGLVNCIGAQGV